MRSRQPQPFHLFALGTHQAKADRNSILHAFHDAVDGDDGQNKLMLDGPSTFGDRTEANVQEGVRSILAWLRTAQRIDGKYKINMAGYSRGAVTCLRIANRLQSEMRRLMGEEKRGVVDLTGQPITLDQLELNIFGIDPVAGPGDRTDPEARNIPAIVKSYKFTLQKHERRQEFAPQDITRMGEVDFTKTKVEALPMPGPHWTTTASQAVKINHATELTWHHLFDYMTGNGSSFSHYRSAAGDFIPELIDRDYGHRQPLTVLKCDAKHAAPDDVPATPDKSYLLLKLYTDAKAHEQDYIDEGRRWEWSHVRVKRGRTFLHHLEDYVADSDCFINQEHRNAFKMCYPDVFSYLFNSRFEDYPEKVKAEIQRQSPDYIRWLKSLRLSVRPPDNGVTIDSTGGSFPIVGSNGIEQRCPEFWDFFTRSRSEFVAVANELTKMKSVPGLFESLEGRGIWTLIDGSVDFPLFPVNAPNVDANVGNYHDNILDSPEVLFRQARQMIYNYRRVKSDNRIVSELMAYTSRDEAPRVDEIETTLKAIISSNKSDEMKKTEMLDCLMTHYMELVQRGSTSQLCRSLQSILQTYGRTFDEKHAGKLAWCVATVGESVKLVGKAIRLVGQLCSTVGGAAGDTVTAIGRFFTNRSVWWFGMKYWLGYPLRKVGEGIKWVSTALEGIGNKCCSVGKWIVGASGRHTITSTQSLFATTHTGPDTAAVEAPTTTVVSSLSTAVCIRATAQQSSPAKQTALDTTGAAASAVVSSARRPSVSHQPGPPVDPDFSATTSKPSSTLKPY
jgi:hypothetical protein